MSDALQLTIVSVTAVGALTLLLRSYIAPPKRSPKSNAPCGNCAAHDVPAKAPRH